MQPEELMFKGDYTTMMKKVKKVCKDHGFEDGRSHNFRTSRITHLHEDKIPVLKISRFIGHSDIKTTEKYIKTD